jgi:NAD dependent epimerase/dehydratase family enzyme
MRHGSEFVAWTPSENGPWAAALDGAHAVIHLAGANNFAQRWSKAYKQEIRDSRVIGARGLVNAMRQASIKPNVFVCGSGVHYYGQRDDTVLDEQGAPGNDFLSQLVQDWEGEAAKAEQLGVRTVMVRTGLVLGSDKRGVPFPLDIKGASLNRPGVVLDFENGALPLMALPFHLFTGGPIGTGKQWYPWIHIDDEIGLIMMALENEQVRGPINATAPEPVTSAEFGKTLGRVMNRPSWFPVPTFALKLLLGEVTEVLVSNPRAVPRKAQELGYQFKYPTAESALRQLFNKK